MIIPWKRFLRPGGVMLLIMPLLLSCQGDLTGSSAALKPLLVERIADFAPGVEGTLAYDSDRDRLLFVAPEPFQTWQWFADHWEKLTTERTPPDSAWIALNYFPPTGVFLLLCGVDLYPGKQPPPESWIFDGSDWRRSDMTIQPPGNMGVLVYDSIHRRMLYTGSSSLEYGYQYIYHHNFAVWSFDGVTWTDLPLTATIIYYGFTRISGGYDPVRDRLVLSCYAEGSCGSYYTYTWEFDGSAWVQMRDDYSSSGIFGTVFWDEANRMLLLVESHYDGSTRVYRYDAGSWTLLQETPNLIVGSSIAYDRAEGCVYAYRASETLTWSAQAGWTFKRPPTTPGNFSRSKAAWFEQLQGIVIVLINEFQTGSNSSSIHGETWLWNGTRFTNLQAFPEPSLSTAASFTDGALAEDPVENRVLLFMPRSSTTTLYQVIRTLAFGGTAWTQPDIPGTLPSEMHEFSACYYPERQSIILFGLQSSYYLPTQSKTWEFRAGAWSEIVTEISPPMRKNAALVYDAGRKSLILFGGYDDYCLNDTWEFHGREWRELSSPVAPPFRDGMAMVYERHAARIVMLGGRCGQDLFGDLWEFNQGSWRQPEFSGPGLARFNAAYAYDPVRQVMVIAGGVSGPESHGTLHELSYQ